MSAAPLCVAFSPLGTGWQGGRTLVMNCIRALQSTRPKRMQVRIVGADAAAVSEYADEAGADGVIIYRPPTRWSLHRLSNAVSVRLKSYNLSLGSTLARAGVEVLVGEGVSWQLGSVATVGWLQDFQHLYLPELFSANEIALRNRKFLRTLQLADRLLAFASVADHARRFAPKHAHKVRAIRPFSIIDPLIYERDCQAVLERYGLPERFLYVPNQFWTHKNHIALLRALRMLRQRNVVPHVVFTGSAQDYRDPGHFDRLLASVSEWGLREQVHFLGVVDRVDVFDLMRQSICVVNPSRFEGWGYSVDEAAAIGKRILASDIPAHREQALPACTYFNPTNPEEIAETIASVWETGAAGPDKSLESMARRSRSERTQALGASLLEVLEEAVDTHRAR